MHSSAVEVVVEPQRLKGEFYNPCSSAEELTAIAQCIYAQGAADKEEETQDRHAEVIIGGRR
jgi:hypothetical protein